MPRDAGGNFSLVAGNPVVSGTTIATSWGNDTMEDLAQGLTDSLDRLGRGGMLAPFRFADGTELAPGAAWSNEPTTGFYRDSAGDLRVTVLNQDVMRWNSGTAQVWDGAAFREVIYASGPGSVPDGNADGQIVTWDQTTNQVWELSTTLVANSVIGLVTAFDGSNLRGWTISDSTVLHVERAADVAINLAGGSINQGLINFGDAEAEAAGQIVYDHLDDAMQFWTNTLQRLTILSGGNVGINVVDPARKFEVDATQAVCGVFRRPGGVLATLAFMDDTTTTDAQVRFGAEGNDAVFYAGSSERMRILGNGGNVGIGTNAPPELLSVTAGTANSTLAIFYGTNNSIGTTFSSANRTGGAGGTFVMNALFDGSGGFAWDIAGVEMMRIANNGFVGIGAPAPTTLLSVEIASTNNNTSFETITLKGVSASGLASIAYARGPGATFAGVSFFTTDDGVRTEKHKMAYDGVFTGLFTGTGISQPDSKFEVVSSLPGTPDDNTIYFVV